MSRPSVDSLTAPVRVALFALVLVVAFGVGAALGAVVPAVRSDGTPSTTTIPAAHDVGHTAEHALAALPDPGHLEAPR